jgi:DNA-binding NarL/FixJ family response regulator
MDLKPQVLLVDDHALLLDAFERLLSGFCEIVGKVSDGLQAIAAAEKLKPDIVILDIGMPVLNGLESGREIHRRLPDLKLLFLTMNEDADMAAEAFRAGASGYLLKRSAASELLRAIQEIMQGRAYVTPLVTGGLVGALSRMKERPQAYALSARQREVLRLLAAGRPMKDVAAELNVAPRTIAFHKYQMMRRLNIQTTAELIQYAVKQSIV